MMMMIMMKDSPYLVHQNNLAYENETVLSMTIENNNNKNDDVIMIVR